MAGTRKPRVFPVPVRAWAILKQVSQIIEILEMNIHIDTIQGLGNGLALYLCHSMMSKSLCD